MTTMATLAVPLYYFSIITAAVAGYFLNGKIFSIFLLAMGSAIFLFIYEKIQMYVITVMFGATVEPSSSRLLLGIAATACAVAIVFYFSSQRLEVSSTMLGIAIYTGHAFIRKREP